MSVKKSNNKGIKLIKKSNELIEARYKFDIWETRIFTSVLSQIARDDEDFRVYRIYLRDVIKDFGINNGNAYDLLRDAADSLMNKKFFLDYEGDGAERKKVYHIIRSVDYMTKLMDENKRSLNEYIDVSVDPDMKPFLIQLKEQFTTYDVRNIIKFKSSYTVRIYELLKQHETFGRRKLEVEYLKRAFDLNEEYPLFANFYQKVIEPAYRDINEYTDLTITSIEKLKDGKKISALMFKFHPKADHVFEKKRRAMDKPMELPFYKAIEEPSKVTESNSIDILFLKYQGRVVTDFGVTPTVFIAELSDKTEAQIERAIRVTDEAKKKK
jgi:plasmid replication initiation protein